MNPDLQLQLVRLRQQQLLDEAQEERLAASLPSRERPRAVSSGSASRAIALWIRSLTVVVAVLSRQRGRSRGRTQGY